MDLRLFSIEQVPRSLPLWGTILDDLGAPPAPRIAKALDVGASTVYRWNATGSAPRMACLALFWLTRWGRSEIDARATNDAMTAVGRARSLSEERAALRARVQLLTDECDRLRQVVQRFASLHLDRPHGGPAAAANVRVTLASTETSPELDPCGGPLEQALSGVYPYPDPLSERPDPRVTGTGVEPWPGAPAWRSERRDSGAARAAGGVEPGRAERRPPGRGQAEPLAARSTATAATEVGQRRQASETRLPRPAARCSGAAAPAPALNSGSSSSSTACGQPDAAAARPQPATQPADPFAAMCARLARPD